MIRSSLRNLLPKGTGFQLPAFFTRTRDIAGRAAKRANTDVDAMPEAKHRDLIGTGSRTTRVTW